MHNMSITKIHNINKTCTQIIKISKRRIKKDCKRDKIYSGLGNLCLCQSSSKKHLLIFFEKPLYHFRLTETPKIDKVGPSVVTASPANGAGDHPMF